jgi:hypothetical protein
MEASTVRITFTAIVLTCFFSVAAASAASITARSCAQPDVQAAIDSANDGDTVNIPAGNCAWPTHVGWQNKDVWVRGAGVGQTVIARDGEYAFYIAVSNSGKGAHRLSDMTLNGNVTNAVIYITSAAMAAVPAGRWRVDHIRFDFPTGQRSGVHVTGVNYGVIDHNTFNWRDGVVIRQAFYLNTECGGGGSFLSGDFANQQALDLGTDRFVFVEDNTFIPNENRPLIGYDSSSGGGRLVWRYNTLTGGFVYNHWTRGCEMAAQVMEFYNNTFIGNTGYNAYPMRLEAGTGVFFNNSVQGYNGGKPYVVINDRRAGGYGGESGSPLGVCDGTHNWDGNAGDPAAPGWPCLGQIGRATGRSLAQMQGGNKPGSAPLYFWNNGQEAGCATGGTCTNTVGVWAEPAAYIRNTPHPNGEVDYVDNNTPKPGYTPYVYPHPLVSGAPVTTRPATPTNVRIVPGT